MGGWKKERELVGRKEVSSDGKEERERNRPVSKNWIVKWTFVALSAVTWIAPAATSAQCSDPGSCPV
eukprot:2922700-Rhodomonas_salina.1